MSPEKIERVGAGDLKIAWSDGVTRVYTTRELRRGCPCATCREKRSANDAKPAGGKSLALTVLSQAELAPLNVTSMTPVGNYAYNIAFSDGHSSGIFTFDLLRELGREVVES